MQQTIHGFPLLWCLGKSVSNALSITADKQIVQPDIGDVLLQLILRQARIEVVEIHLE